MSTGWVLGDGPTPSRLMIVAEAPARVECQTGIPLTGKTGDETNNLLDKFMGIRRVPIYNGWKITRVESEVYCTNVFKYPLNDKKQFTQDELGWMGGILREEIERVNPEVILALGAISTHWFLGDRYDMEALNAVPHMWEGRMVIPSIHPAATFRDTALMSWVIDAFRCAKKALDEEMPVWTESPPTEIATSLKDCVGEPRLWNGKSLWALDTETLKSGNIYMLTATSRRGIAYNVPLRESELQKLRKHLQNAIVLLHNALFDLPILKQVGIVPQRWLDTMHIAFLIQTLPLGLKPLAYRLCGMRMREYDEVIGDADDLSQVDSQQALQYAVTDPDATLRVHHAMLPMWYPRMYEVLERDMDIMPMIISMMQTGMKVDVPFLEELGLEMGIENSNLLDSIRELAGAKFNPKSSQQVSKLLYEELGLGKGRKIDRTKKGAMTTGATTLKKIEDEHFIVPMIEEYRSRKDLIDKYVNVLPKFAENDGRIHAKISMVRVAQSGRLASSKPNLLAQPVRSEDGRRIRNGFVAREGYVLVSGDYSQIEMRLMAHLSQDPVLVKVYNNGGDVHTDTAIRTFGITDPSQVDEIKHRYPSKRTGFLVIYRGTGITLSKILMGEGLSEWTEEKCQWMIDSWVEEHAGVKEFWDRVDLEARTHGRVSDMWGRMKLIPEVYSCFPQTVSAGLRIATNVPLQSGAQGIIKEAMRRMWPIVSEWAEDKLVFPLIQIHDDLLFEVKEEFVPVMVPVVKEIMENAVTLSVPVKADFKKGVRWGTMEKIKEG